MVAGQEEAAVLQRSISRYVHPGVTAHDMPGVAWSGQLILGSMVLSSFQLGLKLADSGGRNS